jgi:competence protein ComEC
MTLIYLGSAWLLGIYLGAQVRPPVVFILLAVLSSLTALVLWRREQPVVLITACALSMLLGTWRFTTTIPHFGEEDLASYNDRGTATLRGVVSDQPDARDTYTNLRLAVESLAQKGSKEQPVRGLALVHAPLYPRYRYGDRLQVEGRPETPPTIQTFSYREYLARQGIHTLISYPRITLLARDQGSPFWAALYAFKERAQEAIARLVPEPQAALLSGILLGAESGIPRDLYERFNATNTSHIIVISGSNISLVVALLMALGARVGSKRGAALLAIGGVALYTILVGANVAVVRAAFMGGLAILALYLGRQATALISLMASAIVLTALNPLALWDLGFQLSFAATAGLILLAPPLTEAFSGLLSRKLSGEWLKETTRFLQEALMVTLAAQVATTPLLLAAFGRLSPVSLLTNFLILPVQPLVMIGGAIATVVGLIPFVEPVARVLAWIPWLALAYTTTVVEGTARLPCASLEVGRPTTWVIILFYGVLLSTVGLHQLGPERRRVLWERMTHPGIGPVSPPTRQPGQSEKTATVGHRHTILLTGFPAMLAILAWIAVFSLPDGRLHMIFLDVGQGDAIFIQTPSGRQILIDGGPTPSAVLDRLGQHMPFWDRSLDLVILTHPDIDHLAGLIPVLERYQVGQILESAAGGERNPYYAQWQALVSEKGVSVQQAIAGMVVELRDGVIIEVLNPPPGAQSDREGDNDLSIAVRLTMGQASFLLTGDTEAKGEGWMLASRRPVHSAVLKVSHHGSGNATTTPFLEVVRPQLAVISVGAGNRFGHPAPEVLERLEKAGVQVLRTDQQGTIEITTDGEGLWLRTERQI